MRRAPTKPRPLPLLDWAATQNGPPRRAHLPRRAIAMLELGVGLLGSTIVMAPLPRLVWNASASAPVGLYANAPGTPVTRGDMVIARPPAAMRPLAAARGYLPADVPLVKRVAAVEGDTVCAFGQEILLDGRQVAERLPVDGHGRALPWWNGCRRLAHGQYFLMMTGNAASFDGRYFGISEAADILGKARALWLR